MVLTVAGTNLVDGHRFRSTDTPVPQQEPPLHLDLECFIICKRWPECEILGEYRVEPQELGMFQTRTE